jgi:ketosteroid isomerase-like protein
LSEKDKDEILKVLETQRIYWNKGNIEAYMEGYWKSDSLRFIGKRGINFGWNNTLESYKKGYPDKEAMGNLTFQVISLEALSNNTAFMIGKWDLDRKEKAGGYFTLVWKRLNGKWLITVDHTS